MKLLRLWRDTRGAAIVEYAVTLPLLLLLMFGVIQIGLVLWTQAGLQHGVEMAARCASVNDAANQAAQLNPPVVLGTSCFGVAPAAVTQSTIQSYAAQNSYALNPPSSTFNVYQSGANAACSSGNLVTATYPFTAMTYLFSITLTAQSCNPT